MRVWRDVLGVFLIGLYLVFFSLSWANALSETPNAPKSPHVLSAQSTLLPVSPGLPDPNKILALTNQARNNLGVPVLQTNPTLSTIAQQRADDMARQQYYAHQSPAGTYYFDSLKTTEFKDAYSCENLGMDSSTSANTYVSLWMLSSQGHKECLLNTKVSQVGYGVAELPVDPAHSENHTYIVVAIHAGN